MGDCWSRFLTPRSRTASTTTLAAHRILTGPASQNILFWAASIGPPARSPRIRLAARRCEIAKGLAIDRVLHVVPAFSVVSSMEWVICSAHLFAERRVPPGAIFRDENRGLIGQEPNQPGPDQAGS